MSNLVITIISIALVAITALAGIYYGGPIQQSYQASIIANTMISQSGQINAAARAYAADSGQDYTYPNFTLGALVANKYLSTYPPNASFAYTMQLATAAVTTNPNSAARDYSCYNLGGYSGTMWRTAGTPSAFRGRFLVTWQIFLDDPPTPCALGLIGPSTNGAGAGQGGFENSYYATHPMVLAAIAINKQLQRVPSTATYAPSGLPYAPTGFSSPFGILASGTGIGRYFTDSSGTLQVNYCFLNGASGATNITNIYCVFES